MTTKPSIDEFAESAKAATHDALISAKAATLSALIKASYRSVLTTSPLIDKVASWFLAGIGATLALIVGNLDKTLDAIKATDFFEHNRISLVLIFLIVAGLFGLLQKYMAIRVQIWMHISEEIYKSFPPIFKAHNELVCALSGSTESTPDTSINIAKLLTEIETSVPWYLKHGFKMNYEKSTKDQLHGLRTAAQFYNHQILYALGELFSAIFALALLATGI